jgi:hypothetical protein
MVRDHQVDSEYWADPSPDAAIQAQVTVDRFRSPPQKFLNGFIRFCATKIPLLPVDLGSHKPRKNFAEFTGSLAAIAAKEKSWTHRLIDENKFLRERLVKVRSPP